MIDCGHVGKCPQSLVIHAKVSMVEVTQMVQKRNKKEKYACMYAYIYTYTHQDKKKIAKC